MVTINVVKKFEFNHIDGHVEQYAVGQHEVSEDFAKHWFVAGHCAELIESEDDVPKKKK